jgi:hypothetical protein
VLELSDVSLLVATAPQELVLLGDVSGPLCLLILVFHLILGVAISLAGCKIARLGLTASIRAHKLLRIFVPLQKAP